MQESVFALWKGVVPHFLLGMPLMGLQFGVYGRLRPGGELRERELVAGQDSGGGTLEAQESAGPEVGSRGCAGDWPQPLPVRGSDTGNRRFERRSRKEQFYRGVFWAGCGAGAVSMVVAHPLEVWRVRLQVGGGPAMLGSEGAVGSVVRERVGAAAAVGAAVLGVASTRGTLVGAAGGCGIAARPPATIVPNPTLGLPTLTSIAEPLVIPTAEARTTLPSSTAASSSSQHSQARLLATSPHLLSRGLPMTAVRLIPGSGLFFVLHEFLHNEFSPVLTESDDFGGLGFSPDAARFFCGGVAGAVFSFVVHPFYVGRVL